MAMRAALVVLASVALLSCSDAPPELVGRIAHVGLIECFEASMVDAKGRPLSCEPSAVEVVGGRALVISDKETPDELPSPAMWLERGAEVRDIPVGATVFQDRMVGRDAEPGAVVRRPGSRTRLRASRLYGDDAEGVVLEVG